MEIKVEYIPVTSLRPYGRNARKHGEKDVEAIVRSIQEVGFDDPIGVWGEDNLIVEGHGRLLAAQKLGMETVPVIHLDHLTEEQRRAYALVHNRTAELSEWDFDLREEEIATLADFDMSQFGFELSDLHEAYVDDFFDRGLEAKQKEESFTVTVTCADEDEADQCVALLEDNGFKAKRA